MIEVGAWLAGFGLVFIVTWSVGRHLSERNAIHRVMRRRGYRFDQLLEDVDDSTPRQHIGRTSRPSTREVTEQPPEKLRQAS